MKFCCASNVAIKNLKIARKKKNFIFFLIINSYFFQKSRIKKKHIFLDSSGSSRHFDYLFICLGLIIKLLIKYFNVMLNLRKILKIT